MGKKSAIIISASSDIGAAMSKRWKVRGWDIYGTYRTRSKSVEELEKLGVKLLCCDLLENRSINELCSNLRLLCPKWDVLVMAPGLLEPIGPFVGVDFDEWEKSIKVNFTNQMRIVHGILKARNTESKNGPCVLFFAGGGANNATLNYSAYTVSKIALIKMCELLDAEIHDTRFSIIGPGWVRTKIHSATVKAKEMAGENYKKTIEKLTAGECTSVDDVINCCEWLIDSPRTVVSGRNFSVANDIWGSEELIKMLSEDFNMYKLRRYGNDRLLKHGDE